LLYNDGSWKGKAKEKGKEKKSIPTIPFVEKGGREKPRRERKKKGTDSFPFPSATRVGGEKKNLQIPEIPKKEKTWERDGEKERGFGERDPIPSSGKITKKGKEKKGALAHSPFYK